jgi:hypothetical protein
MPLKRPCRRAREPAELGGIQPFADAAPQRGRVVEAGQRDQEMWQLLGFSDL